MKWVRVCAGQYETVQGPPLQIVRTEWEGLKGGKCYLWEVMEPDRYSGWVLTNKVVERTLRGARERAEVIFG